MRAVPPASGIRAVVVAALVALTSCTASSDSSTTTTTSSTTTSPSTALPPPTSSPATSVPPPTDPGPVVAAIGDSQLYEMRDELGPLLPGMTFEVSTVVGLTINEGHFGLRRLLRSTSPRALVVVLGTNNVTDGTFTDHEVTALDDLAVRASAVPCVRWVDVATTTPSAAFNQAAESLNAELRAAASRHGFEVIPWSTELAANPEWLRGDGIHHSEEGQAALAGLIAAALLGCVNDVPPS